MDKDDDVLFFLKLFFYKGDDMLKYFPWKRYGAKLFTCMFFAGRVEVGFSSASRYNTVSSASCYGKTECIQDIQRFLSVHSLPRLILHFTK